MFNRRTQAPPHPNQQYPPGNLGALEKKELAMSAIGT